MLSREQILSAADVAREKVAVPEWGGEVWVKTLTGSERDQFEGRRYRQQGGKVSLVLDNTRAHLCSLALVDDDGKRLFSDADVEALGRKSAAALDRVYDVAARLAGLTAAEQEQAEKNSATAPGSASGSS